MGAGRMRFMRGPSFTYASETNKFVHVHVFVLVPGIGDCRLQNLLDGRGNPLVGGAQRGDRRPAFWPRMRSTTSRAFCAETRMYLASALASS